MKTLFISVKKQEWNHSDYRIWKKVVFSTFVSDKCLILAVNSILRSGARKSASVLWDKVADFVNGTCIPSQLLVFLWNISCVLDKLVRSETILFCLILLNNLCSNFMRLQWKMPFSIGIWEFSKLQKIHLRNTILNSISDNIPCNSPLWLNVFSSS